MSDDKKRGRDARHYQNTKSGTMVCATPHTTTIIEAYLAHGLITDEESRDHAALGRVTGRLLILLADEWVLGGIARQSLQTASFSFRRVEISRR